MYRNFSARDVPEKDLVITADAVRLCRAATSLTTAQQVLTDLRSFHPEADESQILRCAGFAAKMLDPRKN